MSWTQFFRALWRFLGELFGFDSSIDESIDKE
jgi:hypothetical protein